MVAGRRDAPLVAPLPRLRRPLAPVPPTVPPLPRRAHHCRSPALTCHCFLKGVHWCLVAAVVEVFSWVLCGGALCAGM